MSEKCRVIISCLHQSRRFEKQWTQWSYDYYIKCAWLIDINVVLKTIWEYQKLKCQHYFLFNSFYSSLKYLQYVLKCIIFLIGLECFFWRPASLYPHAGLALRKYSVCCTKITFMTCCAPKCYENKVNWFWRQNKITALNPSYGVSVLLLRMKG